VIDVPQEREAPPHLRAALRALDPSVEVIHLGGMSWCVGRVRPTNESVRIAQRMLATYWAMSDRARAHPRSVRRYRLALAALQGFRPIQQYTLRELDDRVVKDFQESAWRMTHTRGDLLDEWEAASAQEREARRAQFRDEDRAREALNYVQQSNFGYAVPSVASSRPAPIASGRTRHAIPA